MRANAADRPVWLPGSKPAAHLNGTLPGDFGFDPLNLGSDPEKLRYFAEAERVHARWAMAAVAGILVQEVVRPDIFWYSAPTQIELPFNILGLVAFQVWAMHFVELKRYYDWRTPGSVDQDPLFPNNKLPAHEVGYPGGIFDPMGFSKGNIAELKQKEIKNGRLAMLAFVGFTMAAQTTGKGPLGALAEHLANPSANNMFNKAVIVPGDVHSIACAIPATATFQGIEIPTPCLFANMVRLGTLLLSTALWRGIHLLTYAENATYAYKSILIID